MDKKINIVLLIIILIVSTSAHEPNANFFVSLEKFNKKIKLDYDLRIENPPEPNYYDNLPNHLHDYINKIAILESTDNYKAVNKFGYIGRYQFGISLLKRLNIKYISEEHFLNTPELQNHAMAKLILHNQQVLKNYNLYKYIGKKINGVTITEEGLLAASHLIGPFWVDKYIKSNGEIDKKDGNTNPKKCSDYIKYFEH
jgi:hypothetical protein